MLKGSRAATTSGTIRRGQVEGGGGGLRLETSFARASVTDFKGTWTSGESGAVDIKNIGGRADIRNSFSPVTFRRVQATSR
jgi:hypothetical protein